MKGIKNIYVLVAESSAIVRNGLIAVLKRLPNFNIQAMEIASIDALHHAVRNHEADIVLVNPTLGGWFNLGEFKALYPQTAIKYAAVLTTLTDMDQIKEYDEHINLFDNMDEISSKLIRLMQLDGDDCDSEQEALSQREKEIVCYVVKGLTNKEIAEKLFISVHTVITHRRNISRKLQIHSPAGLTIYAMVNKLVDIKDVNLQ